MICVTRIVATTMTQEQGNQQNNKYIYSVLLGWQLAVCRALGFMNFLSFYCRFRQKERTLNAAEEFFGTNRIRRIKKLLSCTAHCNKPVRQKCCTAGDVDVSRAENCLSHEFSQSIADARVERDTQS